MKANVSIDISDEQRDRLANLIDGKVTKRLATRKDIVDICNAVIDSMSAEQEQPQNIEVFEAPPTRIGGLSRSLLEIDSEDAEILKGKSESYIRGWNNTKRRFATARKRQ